MDVLIQGFTAIADDRTSLNKARMKAFRYQNFKT